MEKSNLYINENGVLVNLCEAKSVICGLYAAMGYNGGNKGDLFAVITGPVLAPVYNKKGNRKNVGEKFAGMSYNFRRNEWYKE